MATLVQSSYTISDYLKGKVRGITVPDNTLLSVCCDVNMQDDCNIDVSSSVADLSTKEKELATAYLYVWLAGGPIQSGSAKESDADWSQSNGGERMSANALKRYLDMANDIFAKYEMPIMGVSDSWGFVGHGFRNPRRFR